MPNGDGTSIQIMTHSTHKVSIMVENSTHSLSIDENTSAQESFSDNYHLYYVPMKNFTMYFGNKQFTYTTPSIVSTIVVTSDSHGSSFYQSRMPRDADLYLSAGDLTDRALDTELPYAFKSIPRRPYLISAGNHDTLNNFSFKDFLVRNSTTFY